MLETICEVMKEAYKRNWITARDGNASIREHSRDYFFITPSGVRKQILTPDLFKKLKVEKMDDGSHRWTEMNYTDISSKLKPSGELPLHFGLQKEMGQHEKDVRIVLHLHPTYCVAAMHAGLDLQKVVDNFPELSRYTHVAPNCPDVPPTSNELADHCHRNLGLDEKGFIKHHIIGIKGHGIAAIDTSPWRAFEHVERLEHICQIILASGNF